MRNENQNVQGATPWQALAIQAYFSELSTAYAKEVINKTLQRLQVAPGFAELPQHLRPQLVQVLQAMASFADYCQVYDDEPGSTHWQADMLHWLFSTPLRFAPRTALLLAELIEAIVTSSDDWFDDQVFTNQERMVYAYHFEQLRNLYATAMVHLQPVAEQGMLELLNYQMGVMQPLTDEVTTSLHKAGYMNLEPAQRVAYEQAARLVQGAMQSMLSAKKYIEQATGAGAAGALTNLPDAEPEQAFQAFGSIMAFIKHIFGTHIVTYTQPGSNAVSLYYAYQIGLDYITLLLCSKMQKLPVLHLTGQCNGKTTLLHLLRLLMGSEFVHIYNQGDTAVNFEGKRLLAIDGFNGSTGEVLASVTESSSPTCFIINTNAMGANVDAAQFWVLAPGAISSPNTAIMDDFARELPAFRQYILHRQLITTQQSRLWFAQELYTRQAGSHLPLHKANDQFDEVLNCLNIPKNENNTTTAAKQP
jgi:hypothetical protein